MIFQRFKVIATHEVVYQSQVRVCEPFLFTKKKARYWGVIYYENYC